MRMRGRVGASQGWEQHSVALGFGERAGVGEPPRPPSRPPVRPAGSVHHNELFEFVFWACPGFLFLSLNELASSYPHLQLPLLHQIWREVERKWEYENSQGKEEKASSQGLRNTRVRMQWSPASALLSRRDLSDFLFVPFIFLKKL